MKSQMLQKKYLIIFFKAKLCLLACIAFSGFSLAGESIIDQDHKLPKDYEAQWERLVSDVEPKLLGGGGSIDPHLEILKQFMNVSTFKLIFIRKNLRQGFSI